MALHIWFRIITAFSFAFVWHEQIILLGGKRKYASIRTKMSDFKKLIICSYKKKKSCFKVVCFQNTIEKLLKDFSHSAQVIWISTSNFHFLWIIKIKLKFNESNWSLSRFLPSVSNDGLFFFANKFLMCNELSKETNLGRFFFSPDGGLESKISNKNPWPTFWLLLVDLNVFQGVLKTLMF